MWWNGVVITWEGSMNNVIWAVIGAVLLQIGASIKKLSDAGTPITLSVLLKEIFTFN